MQITDNDVGRTCRTGIRRETKWQRTSRGGTPLSGISAFFKRRGRINSILACARLKREEGSEGELLKFGVKGINGHG